MDYSRPHLSDLLAADYVCGTLRGPARRRFEQLLPAHAALRGAVREWNHRLMPLTGVIAPVAPPPAVWKRIESRLAGGAASAGAPASVRGASGDAATGWWARLGFWRGAAAFATVAAVGLGVLMANPGPGQAPVVVVLSAAAALPGAAPGAVQPASFVAGISGDGRAVVTRPIVPVSVQADRSLELWAIPGSGAPRSLGVISSRADTRVVRQGGQLAGAAALAVSLEPSGGSPSGAPTGPVLYVGKLAP